VFPPIPKRAEARNAGVLVEVGRGKHRKAAFPPVPKRAEARNAGMLTALERGFVSAIEGGGGLTGTGNRLHTSKQTPRRGINLINIIG